MTIKTLAHIHKLLQHDFDVKEKAVYRIRELYHEALNLNTSNLPSLERLKTLSTDSYYESKRALQEFEDQEF